MVILLLLIVAYTLVVQRYNAEGSRATVGGVGATSASGLLVTIEPIAVNTLTDQATVDLSFTWQGSDIVDGGGRLRENTRVTISSSVGTQEVKFLAGDALGRFETTVGLDGEQSNYPFDVHSGLVAIGADTYVRASDGSLESTGDLEVGLQSSGGVSGWDTTTTLAAGMSQVQIANLSFDRAFSTQAFAMVLLALGVLLSMFALIVGILAFTNRRRAEVGLMSWTAALLFALPLLRNYFPYGPPVGASIDIYVYLWVIVAAVIAAALNVVAWMNQSKVVLDSAPHDPGGSAATSPVAVKSNLGDSNGA